VTAAEHGVNAEPVNVTETGQVIVVVDDALAKARFGVGDCPALLLPAKPEPGLYVAEIG
jgi:hypothetical protein